jgi:hypothetical protein
MKHKLTSLQCLVAHCDKNGNTLPACRICDVCWEYVAHDEVDNECPGPREATEGDIEVYTDKTNGGEIVGYKGKTEFAPGLFYLPNKPKQGILSKLKRFLAANFIF